MVKSVPYIDTSDTKTPANGVAPTLDASYIMSDETCVRHFLEAHPYLPPLLDEAHPYIARCFPNASLTLRVEGDPETGPLADQLVVRIGITSGPEAALAHLKRFDSEWWLDKVAQAQGKLVINLEFI